MSYMPPIERDMSKNTFVIAVSLFTLVIIASNYLVAFPIGYIHIPLFDYTLDFSLITYGALTYPVSFLIMDILSEKYRRKDVLYALRYAILIAFIPSCCLAFITSESNLAIRIAIASVSAFFISQFLDAVIFYRLKNMFPSLWWFRNSVSAFIAQFLDAILFFHIAFFGIYSHYDVIAMALFDYGVKSLVNFIDIPIFYFIAIKTYKKFKFLK